MTQQVQLRRGTASQVAAFTPAAGEVVVDTTNNRLAVGDGATLGGFPAVMQGGPSISIAGGGITYTFNTVSQNFGSGSSVKALQLTSSNSPGLAASFTIDGWIDVGNFAAAFPSVVLPDSTGPGFRMPADAMWLDIYYGGSAQYLKVISAQNDGSGQVQLKISSDPSGNLGIVAGATIQAGGTAGMSGTAVYQVVGGTGTAAQLNVTVSGGAITAINSINNPGSYTVFPSLPAALSYVSGTGSGVTGATVNLSGPTIAIDKVGGVPNASGIWPIANFTSVSGGFTFSLVGSTWAGSYTSGGWYGTGQDLVQYGRRPGGIYVPSSSTLTAGNGITDGSAGVNATQPAGAFIRCWPDTTLTQAVLGLDNNPAPGSIVLYTYSGINPSTQSYVDIYDRTADGTGAAHTRFTRGQIAFKNTSTTTPVNGIYLEASGTVSVNAATAAWLQVAGAAMPNVAATAGVTTINGGLTVTGGTIAAGAQISTLSATQTANTSNTGLSWTITGAGTGTQRTVGFNLNLAAGYTGSSRNTGVLILNSSLGTGASFSAGNPSVNIGLNAQANGAGSGWNIGGENTAANSTTVNIGSYCGASIASNGATNIGLVATGKNTGTTAVQIGAWIINGPPSDTAVPAVSAALIVDNAGGSNAIALFQISNTTEVQIAYDGGVEVGNAPTGGSKGAGTINVSSGIYLNNTAYTNPDYVFEKYFTGEIVRFAEPQPGGSHWGNERRKNYPGLMPLDNLANFVSDQLRLPGITDAPADVFERSDIALEKLEEHTLYILQLNERLAKLEARAD